MKEYDHIGKFVKDKLDGYREVPPDHVWDNIESKIPSAPSTGISNWWIAAAGAVIVAAAVYFFAFSDQDKSTQAPEKASQEMVEEPAETIKKEAEDREKPEQISEKENITKQDERKSQEEKQEQPKSDETTNVAEQKKDLKKDNIKEIQPINRQEAKLSSESLAIQKSQPELETSSSGSLYNYDSVRKTSAVQNKELSEDTTQKIKFSDDKVICAGEKTTLWASGGANYQWSDGSSDSLISVQPKQDEKYTVTVWKTEQEKVVHDFKVGIKECGALYVPNAFSPNSDGYNDKFKAYGVAIEDFHIQIMNKNGVIVYESRDINEGWDGDYNNRPATPGVYLYRIVYTGVEGETKTKTGTLTLIR